MFQSRTYTADQVANLFSTMDSGKLTLTLDLSQAEKEMLTFSGSFNKMVETLKSDILPEGFMTMGAQMDKYAASVSRMFGMSKKDVEGIKTIFAESFEGVYRLGGTIGDVVKTQQALSDVFQNRIIATQDIVQDIFEVNKVTNVEPTRLIEGFRSAGYHTSQIKKQMQDVVDYTRSVGVNVGTVSSMVTDNLGKLNLYNFDNGVQGLAKMAAHSATFGIDMRTTFKIAEDLLSPEKAIDLSASLQRLGVASSQLLDPLKAMDLAQNDPEELQKQLVELSKQFVRTKEDGSFEILPGAKRQMREVAGALGMTTEEFSKMTLQSAEANKKLNEMRLPDFNISEEQKMLIANMSKMDKGEYKVSFTDEQGVLQTKAIEKLTEQDLIQLKKMSEKQPLEILAENQLTEIERTNIILDEIRERGKVAFGASQAYRVMATGARKAVEFGTKEMRKEDLTSLSQMKNFSDLDSIKKMDEKLRNNEKITKEDIEKLTKEVFSSYGELLGKKLNAVIETITGIPNVATTVGENLGIDSRTLSTLISGMSTLITSIGTLTGKLTQFLSNVIGINDFILSDGKLLKYNEKDLIIGGTHLMDVKEPSKVEERLREKEVITNNTISEKTKEIEKNVNIDFNLEPLTKVMSRYAESYEHLNKMLITYSENLNKNIITVNEPNNNISELQKKALDLLDQMSTEKDINRTTTDTTPKNTNIIPPDYKPSIIKNEIVERVVRPTEIPIVNPPSNMGFNTMMEVFKNQEKPIVNVETKTPIVNVTPPMNREITRVMESPTMGVSSSKMEFSDLNVRITLDIPNANNIDKTKIQSVLEETMATIDFKQKMVEAVNAAKTNMGVTANSGTANYGALKQNYGMV